MRPDSGIPCQGKASFDEATLTFEACGNVAVEDGGSWDFRRFLELVEATSINWLIHLAEFGWFSCFFFFFAWLMADWWVTDGLLENPKVTTDDLFSFLTTYQDINACSWWMRVDAQFVILIGTEPLFRSLLFFFNGVWTIKDMDDIIFLNQPTWLMMSSGIRTKISGNPWSRDSLPTCTAGTTNGLNMVRFHDGLQLFSWWEMVKMLVWPWEVNNMGSWCYLFNLWIMGQW